MKIIPFDSAADLAAAQARTLAEPRQTSDAGQLVLISGGSTPRAAFEKLSERPNTLPAALHLLLSDERAVPLSDPQSNAGWIAPLLAQAGLAAEAFTYIHCDEPEAEALARFQSDLDRLSTASFSWTDAFLGMGSDGHTCGLFSLEDADREDVSALAADRADGLRGISVSRKILLQFDRCILTVSGKSKAQTVRDLMNSPDRVIAGRALAGHANVEIWGDAEALSLLH